MFSAFYQKLKKLKAVANRMKTVECVPLPQTTPRVLHYVLVHPSSTKVSALPLHRDTLMPWHPIYL